MRDDGRRAISIIAFIGSVFSPWYAWSGRREPENHVCINVATYGPGGRFAMTDRGRTALRQTRDNFTVGPSSLRWQNGQLIIDVDERGALPALGRVKGQITVTPKTPISDVELPLTEDGAHIWRPFAPTCDIDVDLHESDWQWRGHGYFDANFGTRALEQDFTHWSWGRFPREDGSTCFYDLRRIDGSRLKTGVDLDAEGFARLVTPPPDAPLRRTGWGIARTTPCDPGYTPRQTQPMLDAPFYCRSVVRTRIEGHETTGVHEVLDLTRFRSPLIKPMLAVRVPRRSKWVFKT
ncbi:MAG: carotenoid 1,2-hydratase [Pseudomonadota bacterium]